MAELFASGRVVDLLLLVLALEGLVLLALHQRTGRGIPPADLLGFLLAGAFLMLALRAALTGRTWRTVALWLVLAGLAQGYDVWRRARKRGS